ncbi:diacylglycerol acyltransferase, putative [Trypanosoma cruzi]|uniref:Diacylglycerol acyltransferase, putative n=1 Tax=Trypanosoma cruzi (strain CL Brener) TaxID=353153 RepID=Q4E3C2_TRYCC|nr:diacylglycerol acyltransferase, putative [Trypanosoma cruzi]EAN99252.1 diacylglycerol acyltransferase, putative [Trypanosoma cruzi]|eukprot:XP_821103.1 diacylglycerol acyltransferase [Trypanosoma cruzi strain CL Brener]
MSVDDEKELSAATSTKRMATPRASPQNAPRRLRTGRLGTEHTAVLMTNPMSIALMTVWALSCEGALLLNILADVFQSRAPEFPLVPTITTSVGLNVLCAFLTLLLGRLSFRGFYFYQPFAGGQSFVVMQGFGYGILVVSSVLLFFYVEQIGTTLAVFRYGTLTVLGCFSALADIILMTSLLFFVPTRYRGGRGTKTSHVATDDAAVWWHDLSASPNCEIGIVASFCLAILMCSSFAEYYPRIRRMSSVVGAVLLSLGLFITHVVVGHTYTPGYRLFMPNAGTFRMSLMQAFGWFLAFATLHLEMILYEAGPSAYSSWHILCGLGSVISLSTLLLFIRLHRFPASTQSEISLVGEYGPMVLTLTSSIHAAVVWGLALVLSSNVYDQEPQLRQGLVMCQTLSSLLTFALPPCTHLLGRIAFGREYEVWMPFKGPLEFVVLQSAGWTCFGGAIFFATLQITESLHFRFVIIESSLTALSQGFIHASLHLFDEGRKGGTTRNNVFTPNRSDESDEVADANSIEYEEAALCEMNRSIVPTVLNGEMLTSILLCSIGLIMRVIADVAVGSGSEIDEVMHIPTHSLLKVSTILSILVVPLAHVSMRKRISVWCPFVGCGGYVAMQSIGWSIYAVNLFIVVANSLHERRQGFLSPIVDEEHLFLEYTMEGLLMTLPLVCIIIGAFFETQEQTRKKTVQERKKQEVLELFRVLQQAIPDDDELQHAEALLRAIAGPRWMEPPATDGARLIREAEETAHARQEAATNIVTILSVASALAFISAAFLAERQPVFTLVFGAAGITVTTISCFSVHYVYGTFLHRASGRYSFFMPFSGGPTFVTLQAVGWGFYTISSLLIALSCAEGRGSAIVFVTTGVCSVSAQYCILNSVPRFDPTPRPMSVLELNAEGIFAVLVLIGSFAFAMVYDVYAQGRVSGIASSLFPIAVLAVSTCFAVPLGLVSLKRNACDFTTSPFSIFDNPINSGEGDNEIESMQSGVELSATSLTAGSTRSSIPDSSPPPHTDTTHLRQPSEVSAESGGGHSPGHLFSPVGDISSVSSRHPRNSFRDSVYMTCFMAAAASAILASTLIPFALVYIVYCYAYSGMAALSAASATLRVLLFGFGVAVIVPVFAPGRSRGQRKSLFLCFYEASCCYALYSIPTAVVVCSLGLPFVVKTSGAYAFSVSMVVMSCFSTIPHIHLISMLVNVSLLGYFWHHHFHAFLLRGEGAFTPWKFVVDTVLTAYWPLYFHRFLGQPRVTGRLNSPRFKRLLRRWMLCAVAEHFSLSVIVDGKELNRGEKNHAQDDYVNLNNPKNKYFFSFHPHGIFPGTALWVPNTPQWEEIVGKNTENFLSVHCADVIFAVPMLRDFVLALGCLTVARRGIESSLLQGNSVLVVTGGQAEMLCSKFSDTEMHFVTHHSGFVRVAMTHRVPLVPILSFSENNLLSNVCFPRMQRYTVSKVGFPFPTVPYGKFYLPLPNKLPITIVVGRPILPEPGMDCPENPEHVQRYQQRYFKSLEVLFFKYRAKAGYPNMTLVLHHRNEIHRVSAAAEETKEPTGEQEKERKTKDLE